MMAAISSWIANMSDSSRSKRLRPELIAVVGVDELRRDAHAIARPSNAALQRRPDPQSPADFGDVEILILKCERRGAGNHAQAGNARQRC